VQLKPGKVGALMPARPDKIVTADEAVRLMNESRYGLTTSIWTRDLAVAETISRRMETGTCFANRCDYLDPGLAWTGVKDTGRGCSLSTHAYAHLTRLKSYHFRTQPD